VYTVRGGHGGGRRVHVYRSIATARRPNIGLPELPGEQACAHWRTLGAARRSSRAENNLVIISVKPGGNKMLNVRAKKSRTECLSDSC